MGHRSHKLGFEVLWLGLSTPLTEAQRPEKPTALPNGKQSPDKDEEGDHGKGMGDKGGEVGFIERTLSAILSSKRAGVVSTPPHYSLSQHDSDLDGKGSKGGRSGQLAELGACLCHVADPISTAL